MFYTNLESRKGEELRSNPNAAMCFHWKSLRRSVRVEGATELVSPEEADAYYATRPRGSQLGAWASPQSRVVSGRTTLESALNKVERQFADADRVPVPPHWGGWRIRPEEVEFWQGRRDRMHDRLRFRLGRVLQQHLGEPARAASLFGEVLADQARHPGALAALEELARSDDAAEFAQLAQDLHAGQDRDVTASSIVKGIADLVPGTEMASLTVRSRRGRYQTLAASEETAESSGCCGR